MRKLYSLAIILFVWLIGFQATAQQDPQFSQYMFNTLYYNPAYAGMDGVTKFTFIHRTQWLGFRTSFDGRGGNPNTQVFSVTTPVYKIRGGAGFHVVHDNLGPQDNLELQLSYAYHHKLGETQKITIGARAGIFSQSLDYDQYRPIQDDDPLLINRSGKDSQIRPDLAVGIFFQSDRYYAGVAMNHLLKSEFDFGISEQRNALENNMTFTAGYDYQAGFNLVITPSLLLKTDFNSYSFDVGAVAVYNDKMWGGINFRQSEAAIILLGYSMMKNNALKIGYSFDYIVKGQDSKQPTSHEIMLSYSIPVVKEPRKIIRTPRFRF